MWSYYMCTNFTHVKLNKNKQDGWKEGWLVSLVFMAQEPTIWLINWRRNQRLSSFLSPQRTTESEWFICTLAPGSLCPWMSLISPCRQGTKILVPKVAGTQLILLFHSTSHGTFWKLSSTSEEVSCLSLDRSEANGVFTRGRKDCHFHSNLWQPQYMVLLPIFISNYRS